MVSLRSNHQGANVRVSHADQAKTFSTEGSSNSRYQWLAWYTGAVHEVKPLTFGVQLVLTYNLRLTSSPSTYLVYEGPGEEAVKEMVKRVLTRWTGKPCMLWYMLEKKYSNDCLSQMLLKNNDTLRVRALEAVGSSLGFTFRFGQINKWTREIYSCVEDSGHGLSAKHIVNLDGTAYCPELAITQSEIAQKNRFYRKPDFTWSNRQGYGYS
jgi:hypothetical protein